MRAPVREHDLGRVRHPDPFRPVPGGQPRALIDDPLTRRITDGDPTLGWAGDPRLALYLNVPGAMWELWRLEADGVYRMALWDRVEAAPIADLVPRMVIALVEHDTRRGFDPVVAVNAHNDRRSAAVDAFHADRTVEVFDRLRHALRKDGAL